MWDTLYKCNDETRIDGGNGTLKSVTENRFDAFSRTETSRETEIGNYVATDWELDVESPVHSVPEFEIDTSRDLTGLFESLKMKDRRSMT
jgi:hypothetical protein